MQKRLLVLSLLLISVLVLSGCATLMGIGQDAGDAGAGARNVASGVLDYVGEPWFTAENQKCVDVKGPVGTRDPIEIQCERAGYPREGYVEGYTWNAPLCGPLPADEFKVYRDYGWNYGDRIGYLCSQVTCCKDSAIDSPGQYCEYSDKRLLGNNDQYSRVCGDMAGYERTDCESVDIWNPLITCGNIPEDTMSANCDDRFYSVILEFRFAICARALCCRDIDRPVSETPPVSDGGDTPGSTGERCTYVKDAVGGGVVGDLCNRLDGNYQCENAAWWAPAFLFCGPLPPNYDSGNYAVPCDQSFEPNWVPGGRFYMCGRVQCCSTEDIPPASQSCLPEEFTEIITVSEYQGTCEYVKDAVFDGVVGDLCNRIEGYECNSATWWAPAFFECGTLPEDRDVVPCDQSFDPNWIPAGRVYMCGRVSCCDIPPPTDDPQQLSVVVGYNTLESRYFVYANPSFAGDPTIGADIINDVQSLGDNKYSFMYQGDQYRFGAFFNGEDSGTPEKACTIDIL